MLHFEIFFCAVGGPETSWLLIQFNLHWSVLCLPFTVVDVGNSNSVSSLNQISCCDKYPMVTEGNVSQLRMTYPSGSFGSFWKQFWLEKLMWLHLVGRARDDANHLTMHRTAQQQRTIWSQCRQCPGWETIPKWLEMITICMSHKVCP